MNKEKKLKKIRHSLAHLLAAAVLKKYPQTKLGIGPVIENGFYYDFLLPQPITNKNLKELENLIKQFIKEKLPFKKERITYLQAKKIFKDQPFKLELIKEFKKEKRALTIYKTGETFLDLCEGGHIKNTKEINPQAFQLTHIAGAYWRGDEKNPMLTRIYGVAFENEKELNEYLKTLEEIKLYDHREIGKKQKLFFFEELVGPGLPIWLPNGTIIKEEIEKFAKETEEKAGYLRVSTPHLAKDKLFQISGHLPYYQEDMFPPVKLDDGNYYLKAMNCPIHHLIYKSEPRSYRDLPLRLAEYGTVYRNELSGTLAGLFRVRMLSMNDAHIYCRKDQIEEEFKKVMEIILYYFKIFGLKNYSFRLSCWDPKNKEKYVNEPKNWQFAQNKLRQVLKNLKVGFYEAKNEAAFYGPKVDIQYKNLLKKEAAFYGPKVDIQYKNLLKKEETMSTIQLDFLAKKRFNLTYHDKNGRLNNEVFVIHRAPLSTHERFIGYLIEHYRGQWPLWLAPLQVRILPISEKYLGHAQKILKILKENQIRSEIASARETLSKNIYQSEIEKIPYLIILGEKEIKNNFLTIRQRHQKQNQQVTLEEFLKTILEEIKNKK